ncbi:MAG: hypothetical protein C0501_25255 [Isosphaera sp.]|nr:hypothetical protein [Isosphaera sp.]
MSTTRLVALTAAAALGTAGDAAAAWNNVFQVCCNDRPRASFSAPAPCPDPCPQPCPQPEVRVSYVQRCYYQPVTEMVSRSFYEPVTRNVTSYFYEPVTSYRYSTYYDPCTGCPQRVCTPVTSYRLRSQCNAVTSYVLRTAMYPVTTLRPVTVQQPVVSYYYPPGSSSFAPPVLPPAAPRVEELRQNPPTVVPDRIPPADVPTTPGMSNPRPGSNVKLRPEKTVSRSSLVTVRGEVTLPDQLTPRANARLVFVDADNADRKELVTANAYGEFDARLPAGTWYLYLGGDGGRATYHKQLTLGDRDTYDYKVVSR